MDINRKKKGIEDDLNTKCVPKLDAFVILLVRHSLQEKQDLCEFIRSKQKATQISNICEEN